MEASDGPVAVIGAGIVGVAAAAALARAGAEVLVIEARDRIGEGATSRNSEVLHGGFLSQPGSLRQRFALAGSRLVRDLITAHDLPWNPCGKLLVASAPDEEARLDAILAEARRIGVPAERIDVDEARRLEPALTGDPSGVGWFPESAVIDTHALLTHWLDGVEAAGGMLLTGVAVDRIEVNDDQPVLVTSDGESTPVAAVVNAAGMDADALLAASGADLDDLGWRQEAWIGQWFRVRPPHDAGMDRLVYRTSRPGEAGLGVHTTPDSDGGGCKLGPDSLLVPNLSVDVGRRHPFDDRAEARARFVDRLRPLYPDLHPDQLLADQSGLRSRLPHPPHQAGRGPTERGLAGVDPSDLDGWLAVGETPDDWHLPWEGEDDVPTARVADALVADGRVAGLPGTLHLLGMESPMLTGAAACANVVARWWLAA